ncbi:AAA family ATPase [Thetidibacter halocola]|uniref:Chromosome segregation protein SMC n=1 Tax=Thetidibacter halocola TaxID=2827239 RepID=A0A8J7WFC6_9RHOB|nr:ATP-binding protein [Thetidibacter halocola]MBS0124033.1 chromosome segregation protein SMC [Thetidibacter halocola]
MKLRAITLTNVRRFTDPVRIDGIADGLNVLSEPNETGKSTLFDALHAVFFKPHGSSDKEIKALRPHAGGAPEIAVEIETGEGRFTLSKRWLSRPTATVHRGDRLIAQSDEAEAWIAGILGGAPGGPSGLIWVRQGLTTLAEGSGKEERQALEARRDLMSSVGDEVEAMTGGRRMDAALARVREDLARYATTGRGSPRTGGPWKAALDEVARLEADHAALSETARDLHTALDERKRARAELRALEAPDAVAARSKRLDTARAAHQAALRHAETVEAAAQKVGMSRLAVTAANRRLDDFRAARDEAQAAGAEATRAAQALAERRAKLEQAQATRDMAEAALQQAQQTLTAAQETRRRAERAQAARDGAERRRELAERIAQADAARDAMEQAGAEARIGPDAKALHRLEALAGALASARAARDAAATQIVATYDAGAEGRILLEGAALPGGRALPLPRATRLTIAGVGTLEIRPGGSDAGDSVESAESALREALDRIAAPSLEAARAAAATRDAATRRHAEAQARLTALAPDGIDALREALARIPDAEEDSDLPDPTAAEAAERQARSDHDTARLAHDLAAERLSGARSAAAGTEAAHGAAQARAARAAEAVARLGDVSDEALVQEMRSAAEALAAAEAVHADRLRAAPDLGTTAAELSRADSIAETAQAEIARLKPQIARLEERIARSSGEAVEERLAETAQALEAARADLARIEHEVAVLTRLDAALDAARGAARERYFAPVAQELRPLLQLLWPEADLAWEQDTLLPRALIRAGQEETVDILSGGTQEQLALLVRLAFARMLSKAGRPAPVILDDALVFTDDDRIERMFTALHRQAGDLQILVLTCRQRAFRELGGRLLHLERAG